MTPPSFDQPRLTRAAWAALLVGLILREAIAPWTGHPYDLESFVRTGYAVAHATDPYLVSAPPVPGASFAYLQGSIALTSYPPAWPEYTGGVFALWSRVAGGDRFLLYALLKQPAIVGDLAVAYLLRRAALRGGASEATSNRLLVGWAFFPYAVAISAVWGQFDSLVVALVLAGLLARSTVGRAAGYAAGTLLKWIAGVLVPLELAALGRRPAAEFAAAFGAVLAVALLPFAVQGWSLPHFAVVAEFVGHGNDLGMNFVYVLTKGPRASALGAVPYLFAALGYLWVPAAVAAGMIGARWRSAGAPDAALRSTLFVFLAVLLVRWGLYEQYFLYLFALIALDLATTHPGRRGVAALLVGLASAQLLVNNDLGLRFLTPSAPGLLGILVQGEAIGPWATPRVLALGGLSIAMTVTLVQWVWIVARDEPSPVPWPVRLATVLMRRKVALPSSGPR